MILSFSTVLSLSSYLPATISYIIYIQHVLVDTDIHSKEISDMVNTVIIIGKWFMLVIRKTETLNLFFFYEIESYFSTLNMLADEHQQIQKIYQAISQLLLFFLSSNSIIFWVIWLFFLLGLNLKLKLDLLLIWYY